MRLLLDENLPKKLKKHFTEHEVFTIREKGWAGISNGTLLKLMESERFDVFLTFDQNIQHQQNFNNYTISVLIIIASDNSYATLSLYIDKVKQAIDNNLVPGPTQIKLLPS